MTTYRKHNWPELLKAFEASGLTQTKFCEQRDLNPRYFSLKRSKLLSSKVLAPAFQKVAVEGATALPVPITIQVGRCKIECPGSMPIQQMVKLVQSLA